MVRNNVTVVRTRLLRSHTPARQLQRHHGFIIDEDKDKGRDYGGGGDDDDDDGDHDGGRGNNNVVESMMKMMVMVVIIKVLSEVMIIRLT